MYVAPIYKTRHHRTPCHKRSENIFEALPYFNAFKRYKEFTGYCKRQFLHQLMTLQQDVSKVSLYNLGYICTLLELLFHSVSNDVTINFAC